jgi:hypothetical protein
LEADAVQLTAPGAPSLKASLALELPRRLRLRGDFLMSREIDIGSNDDVFWIWAKSGVRALLYARHDEYGQSAMSRVLPVDPQWLIEALGIVSFDPAGQHAGPYAHGPDQMELHSQFLSATGERLTRVTVIHAVYGWVTEQQIRNEAGQVLAEARASRHRYYPEVDATLPDVVDVQIGPGTPSQMNFRVDIGGYRVNTLSAPPQDLWVMPTVEGYPHLNLADPRSLEFLRSLEGSASSGPLEVPDARYGFRPEYRGYTR